MENNGRAAKLIDVLLVDDDPDMLRLLEGYMTEQWDGRLRVQAFADPEAARQCLETSLIDILITDLDMPEIGGLQLLRCAKRRNAWTQVVVVTGHSQRHALMDAMDLGASDYLVKPLDINELEQCVQEAVSRLRRWQHSLAKTLTQ